MGCLRAKLGRFCGEVTTTHGVPRAPGVSGAAAFLVSSQAQGVPAGLTGGQTPLPRSWSDRAEMQWQEHRRCSFVHHLLCPRHADRGQLRGANRRYHALQVGLS